MQARHKFRPTVPDELEGRVVLDRGIASTPSVVIGGLYDRHQPLRRGPRLPPVTALVGESFDSFIADYTQARSTYFTSIVGRPAPTTATEMEALTFENRAFRLYTEQRVNVLAGELVSSLLQFARGGSSKKDGDGGGNGERVARLVARRINGRALNDQGRPTDEPARGTLADALRDTIPPAGSTGPTAALYALSQDNAIEAARISILNGVSFLRRSAGGRDK